MRRCLILSQNPALAASLKQWLVAKGHAEEEQIAVRTVRQAPEHDKVSAQFGSLCDWLEAEIETATNHQGLPELMVLTDFAGYGALNASEMNPVMHHGWAAVLGMLVLGFPEVHWVLAAGGPQQLDGELIRLHHATESGELEKLLQRSASDFCPLFDAGALRHLIRQGLEQSPNKLPLRAELAAAIDEEQSYAFFHAYTAYRFGFRCQVIMTMAGMTEFLKKPVPQPLLVFEDVFLHFPDDSPHGFSHLRLRDEGRKPDEGFTHLADANFRILVTSGHHHGQEEEARRDNPIYLRALRDNGQWNHELQKPLGGMFNLWKESKLEQKLRDGGRRGLAPGFEWPLRHQAGEGSHSAPGRLLVIADRLIARAERMLADIRTVPQAVYGAVLATDALELLGGKTPTTSLEALMLRHQFEALAECQFVGTQHHVDVKSRIKDLVIEVESLAFWFGKTTRSRKVARWNAELAILNKLIKVFSDHNQFDEDQKLQVRARRLHRKLWLHERPWLKPLEFAPWYVEKLLASVPVFLLAIAGWILIMGLLFHLAKAPYVTLGQGIADAFGSFLGVQPPADDKLWKSEYGWNGPFCLIAATIALGFLHLGIFISHLYSIVTRK
jgi:hypothetical protein